MHARINLTPNCLYQLINILPYTLRGSLAGENISTLTVNIEAESIMFSRTRCAPY